MGQVVGSIPSHGGYSVLRVASRQEQEVVPFAEAQPSLAGYLRDRAMDAYIDSLQDAYADRIAVDRQALERTLGGTSR